ncbi:MAG TPA: hypothetical protein VLM05_03470, partial [Mycobacteriales bacterium]|nr:hypothetical protein [Mycobacteriales bacterium]
MRRIAVLVVLVGLSVAACGGAGEPRAAAPTPTVDAGITGGLTVPSPSPTAKEDDDRSAGPSPVPDAPAAPPGQGSVTCPAATVRVSSADDLIAALRDAKPGDSIALADGTYAGTFVTTSSGTEAAPIFLCGGAGAVLDGGGTDKGYGFHLDGASWWRLVGF